MRLYVLRPNDFVYLYRDLRRVGSSESRCHARKARRPPESYLQRRKI